MAQISLNNINFTYDSGSEPVFKEFSAAFDSNWKLGLVARNGRGKTTLLKLLSGRLCPDSGICQLPRGIRPLLFPPEADHTSQESTKSVIEQSVPELEEWCFMRELSLLAVDSKLLFRPFNTLSPGEQGKIMLAALFANEEAYVLLDEPGNHLDIDGKRILTGYLSGKRGFLLVSHDRLLLDTVTGHTLALLKSGPDLVAGPYHVWADHRRHVESFERAENARLTREIMILEESARQSGQWAGKSHRESRKDDGSGVKFGLKEKNRVKAAKLERRTKQTVRQKERAAGEKEKLLHDIEDSEPIKMNPLVFRSGNVLAASELTLRYDDKILLEKASFHICQGERVCLTGQNGAGKSTLLKLIAGNRMPETLYQGGSMHIPEGLKLSILPQTCELPDIKLPEYVRQKKLDITRVFTLLRKMGFPREIFDSKVSDLSAGQKRKLMLAVSISEEAYLYLWDEPLNYLDIQTREQIEEVLLETCPTLIFTEHDEFFCKKIATKYLPLPKQPVIFEKG